MLGLLILEWLKFFTERLEQVIYVCIFVWTMLGSLKKEDLNAAGYAIQVFALVSLSFQKTRRLYKYFLSCLSILLLYIT